MSTLFISLVGTQIMGTLQPLLAVAQNETLNGAEPLCVRLLATPKVRPVADRLLEYAQRNTTDDVQALDVEDGTTSCADAVAEMAKAAHAAGQQVVFNLDGGQNYMINACVLALAPFSPLLVQASDSRVVLSDAGSSRTLPLPAPLPPTDILALQGVDYTIQSLEGWSVPAFCERGNLPLPQDALCGICIDNIVFDVVWNPGSNRLHFITHALEYRGGSDACKARDRNLLHWASDRVRSSQLYDRKVTVFVQDDKTAERLTSGSAGKLDVRNVAGYKNPGRSQLLHELLQKLFTRTMPAPGNLPAPQKAAAGTLPDNTLVVCLGTNVAPTLLTIATHKPAHVALCYTKKDKTVAAAAERLSAMAPELGIGLTLVPVSIEGLHLDHLLPVPEADARVHVNITPGSKGQGAMLALWAKRHNAAVWSINNQNRTADPLFAPHGESPLPLMADDPVHLFALTGQALESRGADMEALQPSLPLMDGLLAFMRAALDEGKEADVLRKTTRAKDMELARVDEWEWELRRHGAVHSFSIKEGFWFEELTAVAFSQAGAQCVRQGVRFDWNEANRNAILKKNIMNDPEALFHTELDVVGAWGADMFLVSCKAITLKKMHEKMKADATEALHTGTMLGRFALRFLAQKARTKAYRHQSGVMVLGWRELCQPERLAAIFDEQRRAQSTTRD